jgi:hypothetical protein
MDKVLAIISYVIDDGYPIFNIRKANENEIRCNGSILISKEKLEEYKKIQKAYDKMQDELGNLSNYYSGN